MGLPPAGRVSNEDGRIRVVVMAAGDHQVPSAAAVIGKLLRDRDDHRGRCDPADEVTCRDRLGLTRYPKMSSQVGESGMDSALGGENLVLDGYL
jgi:hypothetical protein